MKQRLPAEQIDSAISSRGAMLTRSNEDKIIPGEWKALSGCKSPEYTDVCQVFWEVTRSNKLMIYSAFQNIENSPHIKLWHD